MIVHVTAAGVQRNPAAGGRSFSERSWRSLEFGEWS
jgi:hypothetical protein